MDKLDERVHQVHNVFLEPEHPKVDAGDGRNRHCELATEEFTTELFAEALPLLVDHWKEVAHFSDIPLNPSIDFYLQAQMIGCLRVYTMRDEGLLTGYAVFFVRCNPHYKTSVQAQQDVLYVDPKARGTAPIRFLKYCDEQLRLEGVQAVYHHVKAAHNFGRILERMGYELVDLLYARRLDKE